MDSTPRPLQAFSFPFSCLLAFAGEKIYLFNTKNINIFKSLYIYFTISRFIVHPSAQFYWFFRCHLCNVASQHLFPGTYHSPLKLLANTGSCLFLADHASAQSGVGKHLIYLFRSYRCGDCLAEYPEPNPNECIQGNDGCTQPQKGGGPVGPWRHRKVPRLVVKILQREGH